MRLFNHQHSILVFVTTHLFLP